MTFEAIGKTFGNCLDGDARGVRGDNCRFFADFVNAFHQINFDLKIFDDRFNDNIGFGDDIKIVFEVADRDQFVLVTRKE